MPNLTINELCAKIAKRKKQTGNFYYYNYHYDNNNNSNNYYYHCDHNRNSLIILNLDDLRCIIYDYWNGSVASVASQNMHICSINDK